MSNIYLIYGDEDYFIDREVDKIRNKYIDYDVINYDMTVSNISEALEEASLYSLFSTNKIIICSNSLFLTGTKGDIEHDINALLKYLTTSNDNILVLTLYSASLDNRKKIVKELRKFNVVKCSKLKEYELNTFIKDYCRKNNYKISDSAIDLIIEKLNDNLYIITSELNKLFLYKEDDNITKEDVNIVVSRMLNTNIFDLINAIVEKNIDKALMVYDDLKVSNEEEIKLIVTLANQFRLIYQVKTMSKMGYSESDITGKLCVHPYRVKLAKEVKINENDNIRILRELARLDELIKTGKINKEESFMKFILSL